MNKTTLFVILVITVVTFTIGSIFIFFRGNEQDIIHSKTGTVTYIDLEGGFYGIVDDDGNKYDPLDLPEEFKEDGLRVTFSYKILQNQTSIHMWGTLIELTDIQGI